MESFPSKQSAPEEEKPSGNLAPEILKSMPPQEQEYFLKSLLRKGHSLDTLKAWYGITELEPIREEEPEIQVIQEPPVVKRKRVKEVAQTSKETQEKNTYTCTTAYEYPGNTLGEQERLDALLSAACESASRLGREFVQIQYANEVLTYSFVCTDGKFIAKEVK